ncbi:MAG: PEGA domain-containing protein [bacterium]|nr:PEGA domain-containing protein [bacterium]
MKILYRLTFFAIFSIVVIFVIGYARGYRFDMEKKSIKSTGIISTSSSPKAAKIYANGELKGVTDTNLTLAPGDYNIEIKKDGYTSWSKKFNLKGELVLTADALLFPLNPSLSPLTNLGIVKAIPLDQTNRVILFVENNDEVKDGIYLFEANSKPFISPLKLLILKKYLPLNSEFADSQMVISSDYKKAILELTDVTSKTSKVFAYLLSLDQENTNIFDITASRDTLLEAWNKDKNKNDKKILETFPKNFVKTASESAQILSFSPNETKIMYQATETVILPIAITPPIIASNQTPEERMLKQNHYYIYDRKEDKNYDITQLIPAKNKQNETALQFPIIWYSDSRHLIVNEGKKISVIEYDGANKQTVYSGPFDSQFFTTTSDGNLLVLANLNPDNNKYPDLYTVGIK